MTNWVTQKTKNVAFEKLFTLKPLDFWAGEALDAWKRGCLNNTLAQKWDSVVFKISAEKSFPAWQKKFPAIIEWI